MCHAVQSGVGWSGIGLTRFARSAWQADCCGVQCVLELSKAVGAEGLVAGQVVDMKSERSEGDCGLGV